MNPNPDRFRDESPTDYLRSLVEAMRRVVETSRDRTLAEMREAVETDAGQLDHARTERETSLRERAEADISAVGTWERAEIDRIKAEAQRKVQARSRQLDQELAQLAAATNAEHEALAARADAYEREVAAFMEGLEEIDDPATFASAARQMPSPSSGARVRAPLPATDEPASEAMPEPVSEPMADAAVEPVVEPAAQPEPASIASEATPDVEPIPAESAPEPAPEPASAPQPEAPTQPTPVAFEAPERSPALPAALAPSTRPEVQPPAPEQPPAVEQDAPAAPVATAPTAPTAADRNGDTASADAEQATAIQVRGLSSFGAITSFKQSLEKVDGIHSVTLGLGPSGEFVYTATHAAAIDLDAAIRSIEGTAEIAREGETLRVKVGRRAG